VKIHIVAGILVGYFNAAWSMVFVAALLWGIVFCAFMLRTYKGRKEQYIEKLKSMGKEKPFGLPPRIAFYVNEFVSATGISYVIGMVVFAMKGSM
jgi:MFS family permease